MSNGMSNYGCPALARGATRNCCRRFQGRQRRESALVIFLLHEVGVTQRTTLLRADSGVPLRIESFG
jgi:hypothetical protein